MFANQVKATLILEISGAQKDNVCQNILKLLDMLISEIRVENDTAEVTIVTQNQGKIQAYLLLKDYIERGLPALNRVT